VPLWFNEGLAEFYSTFETNGDAINVGRPREDHLQFLKGEPLLPFSKLFSIDDTSPEYNEGVRRGVFYAESWALVHDLMLGAPERGKQVSAFLTQVSNGTPPRAAFYAAFGMSDDEVDRELRRYIKQLSFAYTRLTSADFRNAPALPAAVTLTRDDTLAYLGDLLVHCTPATIPDGETFLNEALRLNPKHAGATASLALVNLLQNRRSAADALYARAVELGSREWLPYAFAADGLLDRASRSPADLLKARALYERALVLNPDAAHAWAGFGMTFVGGDGDPNTGMAALVKAVKLDPHDLDSYANLALLYLHNDRRADAVRLVEGPLAGAGDRRVRVQDALLTFDANAAIEQIRAGKTAEGTEALTRIMPEVHDPAVRAQIEETLSSVQAYTQRDDQAREFNRAVSFAVSRKWSEALAIVDRLLPEVKDEVMAAKIREFRKQVAEAKKRLK
jgi:tetratricopeptide (TPR) repeat protein